MFLCICVHMDPCNLNLCNLGTSCTSLRGDHIRVGHVVRNAYRIFVERSNSMTTKHFGGQHWQKIIRAKNLCETEVV